MSIKPLYHFSPTYGWMNDPNGLIKFKGKYHIFYQYNPHGLAWGPMHWGHAISNDLLKWEHLPIALHPGDDFDLDGCFSGSAIIYQDKLYLFYTGFIFNEKAEEIKQQQCLAYSEDGLHFTKVGLIIGENNLPKDFAPNDFRDPMVYQDGDEFIMLVAARRKNGSGNILKYKSRDLIKWEYVCFILEKDSKGIMYECSDYVKDLNLLICSEQFHPVEGYNYHNIHSVLYYLGHFENEIFKIHQENMIDYGFDFYAPQVFLEDNILIAWMNMWDRNNPSEKEGFAGSLTIPRKLEIKDHELYQTPICPKHEIYQKLINGQYFDRTICGFYRLEISGLESFLLKIRKGEQHETIFKLENNEWIFDRSHSGEKIVGRETDEDSLQDIRRMPYLAKKHHEIYLVLDKFSVEIFVDGKSMTSLIYPDLEDDLLQLFITADAVEIYKYFEK